jgi:hypothetical protein
MTSAAKVKLVVLGETLSMMIESTASTSGSIGLVIRLKRIYNF